MLPSYCPSIECCFTPATAFVALVSVDRSLSGPRLVDQPHRVSSLGLSAPAFAYSTNRSKYRSSLNIPMSIKFVFGIRTTAMSVDVPDPGTDRHSADIYTNTSCTSWACYLG